jgi:hypothetical protein
MALYNGAAPFLATYCLFVSFQFTFYEYVMQFYRKRNTPEEYARKEFRYNFLASFGGGVIGASITNGFEVLTVTK